MPVRVYEINGSDKAKMKKILSYDPYLDSTVIPKDDNNTEDIIKDQNAQEKISKIEELKKNDPYFDIIFVRQEYILFDGSSISLNPSKCYLYLKANEEFLAKAELKLKRLFPNIVRINKEAEEKVIEKVNEQQQKAESGFGFIFGN
ncbi:MAG: hypothetical protein QXS81_02185 [Candidatus Micrarchaeaceae archaeon]